MLDESQLIRERERASKAQQILDNPLFVETWESMDDNLMRIMSDPSSDDDKVMEARRGLIVLRRLKAQVVAVFRTGEMAQIQLNKEK